MQKIFQKALRKCLKEDVMLLRCSFRQFVVVSMPSLVVASTSLTRLTFSLVPASRAPNVRLRLGRLGCSRRHRSIHISYVHFDLADGSVGETRAF